MIVVVVVVVALMGVWVCVDVFIGNVGGKVRKEDEEEEEEMIKNVC